MTRSTIAAFLLVLLALGTTAPAQESEGGYYVAQNGNDADPGTFQKPWRTIDKANRELQPGDTVYIRAGTYDEMIAPTRSGTADKRIMYAAYELTRRTLKDLVDAPLPEEDIAAILRVLEEHKEMHIGFDALRTRRAGPER